MSFRRLAASAPATAMWAFLATIGPWTGHQEVRAEGQPQRLLVAPDGATDPRRAHDGPLSLRAALEEAARKRASDRDTPLVIALQAGTYELDGPIVIDAGLAGEGGITLEAVAGADVRLVGWKKVESIVTQRNIEDQVPETMRVHITYYALPESQFPDLGPELPRGDSVPRHPAEVEFFVGETPLTPARWPAVGYSRVAYVVDASQVVVHEAPLAAVSGRSDVWLAGFLGAEWHYQRLQVAGVDRASGVIRSARPFDYRPKLGDYAALEGPPSLFSAPGQFYLDRANRVLAVWLPRNDKPTVNASVLNNAITITSARHVRIEGLSVLGVRGDAIRITNSDDVRLDHVQVADTGLRGVVVEGGRNFLMQNSVVHDTGSEAVWVAGGDRRNLVPAGHRILDNVVFRFERRTRRGWGGIRIMGVGNIAERNVVSDAPSQAITFEGNDHLIRRNDISRTMLECGDCGAIYTGLDWTGRGTCVDGNVIHGIEPGPGRDLIGVVGIYLDDGASGITVQHNVIVELRRGVLVGGGRDNVVQENTIIGADQFGVLVDARGVSWAAAAVTDPTSLIRRRLVAVPYDREPYRSRYPHLAELLKDEPGLPKYNRIVGNLFFGGPGIRVDDPAGPLLLTTPPTDGEPGRSGCPPSLPGTHVSGTE